MSEEPHREELGCPGHFCLADRCHYRRHTQVEHYAISTVGDLWIDKPATDGASTTMERWALGGGPEPRYFETMVFATLPLSREGGCGCMERVSNQPVDMQRYVTAREAHVGHEAMVNKWARRPPFETGDEEDGGSDSP